MHSVTVLVYRKTLLIRSWLILNTIQFKEVRGNPIREAWIIAAYF